MNTLMYVHCTVEGIIKLIWLLIMNKCMDANDTGKQVIHHLIKKYI